MPRYIDADIPIKKISATYKEPEYQHEGENWQVGLCIAESIILNTPTADVVEIVRCKNCEHYYDGKCYVANRSPLFKYDVNIHHRKEDDFCSYGEERRSK